MFNNRIILTILILFLLIILIGYFTPKPYAYTCDDIPIKNISKIMGIEITNVTNMNQYVDDVIKVNGGNLCFLYSNEGFVLLTYVRWNDADGYYQFIKKSLKDGKSQIIEVSGLGHKAFLDSLIGGDRIDDLNFVYKGYFIELQLASSNKLFNEDELKKIGAVFVKNIDSR